MWERGRIDLQRRIDNAKRLARPILFRCLSFLGGSILSLLAVLAVGEGMMCTRSVWFLFVLLAKRPEMNAPLMGGFLFFFDGTRKTPQALIHDKVVASARNSEGEWNGIDTRRQLHLSKL